MAGPMFKGNSWWDPNRTPRLVLVVLALTSFMFLLARMVPTVDPPKEWGGHGDGDLILHVFEIGCLLLMVFSIFHAWRTWGRRRTIFFYMFALIYGFFLEEITVTASGYYYYNPNSWIAIHNTMMAVPFCWTAIIYVCIRTMEMNPRLSGLKKLEKGLLAGVLAVSMDAGIDAVFANYGLWHWYEWQWLGVPLANYTAWFMAVGGFTAVWYDVEERKVPQLFKEISLAAGTVISYALLLIFVWLTYLATEVVFP